MVVPDNSPAKPAQPVVATQARFDAAITDTQPNAADTTEVVIESPNSKRRMVTILGPKPDRAPPPPPPIKAAIIESHIKKNELMHSIRHKSKPPLPPSIVQSDDVEALGRPETSKTLGLIRSPSMEPAPGPPVARSRTMPTHTHSLDVTDAVSEAQELRPQVPHRIQSLRGSRERRGDNPASPEAERKEAPDVAEQGKPKLAKDKSVDGLSLGFLYCLLHEHSLGRRVCS